MARPALPPELRRSKGAKTSVRPVEDALIGSIAEELEVTPSEVVYLAVIRLLLQERPDECAAAGIRMPVLVG